MLEQANNLLIFVCCTANTLPTVIVKADITAIKSVQSNPKISESFDLMFGDLELSSGSTRIEKRDELAQRMSNKGMKTDSFEYHLNAFDYGVPPHAGCGIGLERLIMALTGTENIRDTTFYPRDVDRLTP